MSFRWVYYIFLLFLFWPGQPLQATLLLQSSLPLYCLEAFQDEFPPSYDRLLRVKRDSDQTYKPEIASHARDKAMDFISRPVSRELFALAEQIGQRSQGNDLVVAIGNSMNPVVVAMNILGFQNAKNLPFSQPKLYNYDRSTYTPFYHFQKKYLYEHFDQFFAEVGYYPRRMIIMDYIDTGVTIQHIARHLQDYFQQRSLQVEVKALLFTSSESAIKKTSSQESFTVPAEEVPLSPLLEKIMHGQILKIFAQYPSYIPGFGEINFKNENAHFHYLVELLKDDRDYFLKNNSR